jgi:cytochrome c biogenesis protein CcmG/thiol:disulfide interchange protein DsbE
VIAAPQATTRHATNLRGRRLLYLAPAVVFVALTVMFGWGLNHDPHEIPSTMIGKPVPEFSLPPVKGRSLGLSDADLRGAVSLVNVFASWCVACREEHPLLLKLKADGVVPLHGLDYKDPPDAAARWLNTFRDPYTRTGADRDGRVGIEWGVYGVPETFVVGKDGRIAYKHIGPLTQQTLDRTILPLIERLRQQ